MSKIESIIAEIKELKLLEVAELVKAMEEEFGVSAAAPVAVVAAGGADAALAASLFHYKELEIMDLKNYLADRGISVRR